MQYGGYILALVVGCVVGTTVVGVGVSGTSARDLVPSITGLVGALTGLGGLFAAHYSHVRHRVYDRQTELVEDILRSSAELYWWLLRIQKTTDNKKRDSYSSKVLDSCLDFFRALFAALQYLPVHMKLQWSNLLLELQAVLSKIEEGTANPAQGFLSAMGAFANAARKNLGIELLDLKTPEDSSCDRPS